LINGTTHLEEITIANIYAPNVGIPSFIKQTLLEIKAQMKPYSVIVGVFNIPLS
jgi:hypothetical protein